MKRPEGELAFWTVLWTVAGIVLSYAAFHHGQHGFAIIYAALALAAISLLCGIREIKWVLIGYFGIAFIGSLVDFFALGIELRTVGHLLIAAYSLYLLLSWNDSLPEDVPHEGRFYDAVRSVLAFFQSFKETELDRLMKEIANRRRWEVMVELPGERELTGKEIAEKASIAFECKFKAQAEPLDPVDASWLASEENGPVVDGDSLHFFCGLPPYLFEIFQCQKFLQVSYLPSSTYSKELDNGYSWTAKLAAEFIETNPAKVMLGGRNYQAADPTKLIAAMRSSNPEAALEAFLVNGD
jgi:hypothetical protein